MLKRLNRLIKNIERNSCESIGTPASLQITLEQGKRFCSAMMELKMGGLGT